MPADAVATTRTATDHLNGVRFTLKGRTLTLRLVPQQGRTPPDARLRLFGRPLRAVCGAAGREGRSSGPGTASRAFTWKRGDLSRALTLSRNIAGRTRWCVVESRTGSDVAAVDFKLGTNPGE